MLAKFQLSDPLAITEWVDSITSWPQINLGKIFHYIIENKAFDTDYIGQYKVKKAYSYFKSGFVSQILVFNVGNENKILLKSSVLPSQNVSSAEHIVWILADASGNIITAYCSCTAGLSQCCNHVIAVLYKIEYAVSQGFTRPTCTETKSKFNDRSTKIVKGCRVDDLIIEKHMAEKKPQKQSICSEIKSSFDPRFGNKSKIEKNSFFDGLHEVTPNSSIFLSLPRNTADLTPDPLPKVAEKVLNELSEQPYEEMIEDLMKKLVLSDSQLTELERMTRDQSNCPLWHEQRIGRLTASSHRQIYQILNYIMHNKKNVPVTSLLSKIMNSA